LTLEHLSALRAGCHEVISKPFDLAALADTVDRIVNAGAAPLKRRRNLA
jgi:CheY-like chemotaxis protein